jgi:ABC-2 type transport system permease protein
MTRFRQAIRVLRYAALSGFQDFGYTYTIWSWLFGLFVRMLAQVAFFAFIGRLLDSPQQVRFLFVGNVVMAAAQAALTATVATSWERGAGTLPLLVASPTSPVLVLMGRSVFFIANGMVLSLGALLLVAPMFHVALPWGRLPGVVALLVLVTASTYMAATFLGALVLRAPGARRTVANLARLTMMAFCGVSVPRELFPVPVRRAAEILPLTHGLTAIRELFGAGRASIAVRYAALEVLVAVGWLLLAVVTFRHLADSGRRDGSIVFADV